MKKYFYITLFLLIICAGESFAQFDNWYNDSFLKSVKHGVPVTACTPVDTYHVAVGTYLALNHTTNLTVTEAIMIGQQYRIRQNGTLYGVTLYCATKTGPTSIRIRVWRKEGSTYIRIGTCENIYANLTAGQNNTIYFTQPIAGCLEGDYYSVVYDASSSPLQGVADANCTLRYITTTSDSLNYAWDSKTGIAYGIPLTLYMLNPNFVVFTDSRGGTSCLNTTIDNNFSGNLGYKLSALLGGYTYQNMAINGNSSTQGLARLNADMIDLHPKFGVVLFNTNDIVGNVSSNTIVSNNQAIVETMAGNKIRPYFIEDLPNGNLTNAQQRKADSCRTRIRTIVLANGGYVVSTVNTFGVYSDSGDANNKWWLNEAYSSDKVHLNDAGMSVLAGLLYSALSSNGCPSYNVNASIPFDTAGMNQYWTDENALGTITSWSSLKDTNILRQPTTGYKPVKTGSVKFDTVSELRTNIKTQSTSLSVELVIKLDTTAYDNQAIFGIRYTSPTLTVLAVSLSKNSTSPAYKFITSYYAGGGYYNKDYSAGALHNKFVYVAITADSTNRVKVYFNGVLQTVGSTTVSTSYNGNGIITVGATSGGMKDAYIRRIITWRTVLSQSDITSHYNTFNSLGIIDP